MTWIAIGKPPYTSVEQFYALKDVVGEAPDGLLAQYVGAADGELRIVSVWESRQHAERFLTEELGPALAKALGPEPVGMPDVLGLDVAYHYVREPTPLAWS
jgi:hypothetical protein